MPPPAGHQSSQLKACSAPRPAEKPASSQDPHNWQIAHEQSHRSASAQPATAAASSPLPASLSAEPRYRSEGSLQPSKKTQAPLPPSAPWSEQRRGLSLCERSSAPESQLQAPQPKARIERKSLSLVSSLDDTTIPRPPKVGALSQFSTQTLIRPMNYPVLCRGSPFSANRQPSNSFSPT